MSDSKLIIENLIRANQALHAELEEKRERLYRVRGTLGDKRRLSENLVSRIRLLNAEIRDLKEAERTIADSNWRLSNTMCEMIVLLCLVIFFMGVHPMSFVLMIAVVRIGSRMPSEGLRARIRNARCFN